MANIISVDKEIQELCDLVRGNTYEEFLKKVKINFKTPRQRNFSSLINFDFKMLSATIFNEEYIVGMVDIWDEDGTWIWDSEIKERVYFKKK